MEEAKKSGCQGLRSLDILLLFGNMLQKAYLFFYLQNANAGDIMHLLENIGKTGKDSRLLMVSERTSLCFSEYNKSGGVNGSERH